MDFQKSPRFCQTPTEANQAQAEELFTNALSIGREAFSTDTALNSGMGNSHEAKSQNKPALKCRELLEVGTRGWNFKQGCDESNPNLNPATPLTLKPLAALALEHPTLHTSILCIKLLGMSMLRAG